MESSKSLGELLFNSMREWKDNIAQYVPDKDHSETYGELLQRCIRTALKLRETGITENDVISSCTLNDENACVPFLAGQFLGAKVATLHPNISKTTMAYLLKLVEPKVVFVSPEAESLIEECAKKANIDTRIVIFGKSENNEEFVEYLKPNEAEKSFVPAPKDANDTALIMFTSGSTGHPKGVCISHMSLVGDQSAPKAPIYASEHSVILSYATLYWISGVLVLVQTVENGLPRILCRHFDPAATWTLIEKYKVTALALLPAPTRSCIDCFQHDRDVSSLRYLVMLGDKVTYRLVEDVASALPKVALLNLYSQTEFGAGFHLVNVIRRKDIEKLSPRVLSCGKIGGSNYDWKIVDPTSERILGPNEEGELRIRCKSLMNGYYKTDSSSAFDADGYFKTGDLFYHDEENYTYMQGRLKAMFKYRGWQISPTVIEEALKSHPVVEEAIVIDVPHEVDGSHPRGFVKLKEGCENVAPNDIKEFAEDKLADYEKLRGGVEIVRDIPYTVTGKKMRDAFSYSYSKLIHPNSVSPK